ncbi:MAG: class I SAM-dependent RNA methyltransferase, partial [Acidobacteriia bacterium]|nr:class I SAM-dependent RNA methyltransferase [Terriglobia bacterium]
MCRFPEGCIPEKTRVFIRKGSVSIVSNFPVTVEKLVYGGDGLARVDGRVVLAPFVLPGERVLVEPEQEKRGLVRARPVEVLEPAPERVIPPCPYFGRCGGCHYQHTSYEMQLSAKRAILEEILRRQGKMEPPEEIPMISAEPWAYRNRVQLHFEGRGVGDRRMGYREAHSHKLCPITHCPITSPKLNEVIAALREMMRDRRWPAFVRSLEVFTDERQVQLNVLDSAQPVARRFFEWAKERIPGLVVDTLDYEGRFRVNRNSFFQVNRFLIDALVRVATASAQGDSAIDLYSGVGLFALALARTFSRVVAVESGAAAVRDLEFNAERSGVNVQVEHVTAEAHLEGLETAPDFLLLDPPRAGIGK